MRRLGHSFFFNPGSVGVVYDRNSEAAGDPFDSWAEYAILDASDGTTGLELRRVSVDASRIAQEILACGVPSAVEKARKYQPR